MSETGRYWTDADDIPSGVIFRNPEDWDCIWVADDEGNRTLHYAEMVPVKYERKVTPIEDSEDADWAVSYGPYLEVVPGANDGQ